MIRDSERPSYTKNEVRGCIDLGSTNFRLLVVEGIFPVPGRAPCVFELRSFNEAKRHVGWGDDLACAGIVSSRMESRAACALGELIDAARGWGCARPFVVATNTLRESVNARSVASSLEAASDVSIRVLSQREEAAFGYFGASFFRGEDEAICLIDVGGTSTEISWGRGTAMEGYAGLLVGTHRVERILADGVSERRALAIVAAGLRETGAFARDRGAGVYPLPDRCRDSTMLMTGGTAVSLAVFHRLMQGCAPSFEEMHFLMREDVVLARRRVAGLRRSGRERSIPLDAGRIKLFPAGLVLIDALLSAARIEAFRVTARDLRWGIVLTGGASV